MRGRSVLRELSNGRTARDKRDNVIPGEGGGEGSVGSKHVAGIAGRGIPAGKSRSPGFLARSSRYLRRGRGTDRPVIPP